MVPSPQSMGHRAHLLMKRQKLAGVACPRLLTQGATVRSQVVRVSPAPLASHPQAQSTLPCTARGGQVPGVSGALHKKVGPLCLTGELTVTPLLPLELP